MTAKATTRENRNKRSTPERDLAEKAREVYSRYNEAYNLACKTHNPREEELRKKREERAKFFIDQETADTDNEANEVHRELARQRGLYEEIYGEDK